MPDLTPDVERDLAAIDDALAGRRVAADLTELGELALALRDERPRPTDGFGRFLDARAERGFPGRDPRVRVSGRRWWRTLLNGPALGLAAAVMVVAVIVVSDPAGQDDAGGGSVSAQEDASSGGSAGAAGESGGGASAQSAGEDHMRAAAEDAAAPTAPEPTASEPLPAVVVPPAPAPGPGSPGTDGRARRSVERSASLTLAARPRDIDTVSARIQEVTRQQGGFVVTSAVSSSADGGGGTFELRVPTRNLDAAMAARSRLRDARTERKSLLRQLGDAVTLTDTESIRARLRLVSVEIERARADVRRVNNRAAFSTVSVTLVADASAVPLGGDDDWTPGDAAEDALRVLEVAAGVAVIALAVVIPLALLGGLAAIAARWTRRRRREHALDAV